MLTMDRTAIFREYAYLLLVAVIVVSIIILRLASLLSNSLVFLLVFDCACSQSP